MKNVLKKALAMILVSANCMSFFSPISAIQLRINGDETVINHINSYIISSIKLSPKRLSYRELQSQTFNKAKEIFYKHKSDIENMPFTYTLEQYKELFEKTVKCAQGPQRLFFCLLKCIFNNENIAYATANHKSSKDILKHCQKTVDKITPSNDHLRYFHFIFIVYFAFLDMYRNLCKRPQTSFHNDVDTEILALHRLLYPQLPQHQVYLNLSDNDPTSESLWAHESAFDASFLNINSTSDKFFRCKLPGDEFLLSSDISNLDEFIEMFQS